MLKSDLEKDSESAQLNAIISYYHNFIRELNAVTDVYSRSKGYANYFNPQTTIRMVRTVPSLSDTLHIIIVLDQTDNNDLRKFVFLQQTPTKTKELINSDKLMISKSESGRMGDMLIDIYTQNDLFTIAIYNGSNWSHGVELTYGKFKNSFKLTTGVGYSISKIKHDYDIYRTYTNLYFFEQGSELENMIYGETPRVIGNYYNIDIEQTKRFFKYLEVY